MSAKIAADIFLSVSHILVVKLDPVYFQLAFWLSFAFGIIYCGTNETIGSALSSALTKDTGKMVAVYVAYIFGFLLAAHELGSCVY